MTPRLQHDIFTSEMNVNSATRALAAKGPPSPQRARHGLWVAPAKVVKALVDHHQWNVSEAVRRVVARGKYGDKARAFRGIRAAYYVLRRNEETFEL